VARRCWTARHTAIVQQCVEDGNGLAAAAGQQKWHFLRRAGHERILPARPEVPLASESTCLHDSERIHLRQPALWFRVWGFVSVEVKLTLHRQGLKGPQAAVVVVVAVVVVAVVVVAVVVVAVVVVVLAFWVVVAVVVVAVVVVAVVVVAVVVVAVVVVAVVVVVLAFLVVVAAVVVVAVGGPPMTQRHLAVATASKIMTGGGVG
jgi:hypothetical protein